MNISRRVFVKGCLSALPLLWLGDIKSVFSNVSSEYKYISLKEYVDKLNSEFGEVPTSIDAEYSGGHGSFGLAYEKKEGSTLVLDPAALVKHYTISTRQKDSFRKAEVELINIIDHYVVKGTKNKGLSGYRLFWRTCASIEELKDFGRDVFYVGKARFSIMPII